ncbi:signal recognition particle-docking protein FtsY [Tyzzerella sp. An114]|nr:signal recognition particle-docking protein FtsY [Tyzzerella sp. An114]OUQ59490.1 signal recognition particle-docking protein FtsY [Tyzzerella sp. An114]
MGFFDFLKGKKKNTDENVSQENINESSSNVLEEIEGIEVTPFEPEEKGRTPEEIFRNKQEFKADITIAKIPDITAEELERAIHEDEEETEEIEEVTEIIDEPEISEEITENAEEIEETTENTEEVSEEVEETTEEIEEVIEETVEEEKEEIKEEVVEEKPTKKGFFAKLFAGLDKTRKNILGGVDAVLGAFTKIDEELFEELEEVLIMADIGVETTMNIIDNLRKRVKREKTTDPQAIKGMLVDEITELLNEGADDDYDLPKPTVMLVIGVNGVGKTTTIGKLSHNYKDQGDKVLLAAADTFRAAAIDQLKIWGERAGIDVIRHEENSDPAAVVFDAVNAAKNRGTDILICDTAGRLHNKKNLMEELKKISKVIDREYPQANKEVYLVLDATTGQNAMQQAKLFKEVADITGIILTKLDGTAKGGIVIAIKSELNIPVRYIGVGEGINDLQKFNARDFASALFGNE